MHLDLVRRCSCSSGPDRRRAVRPPGSAKFSGSRMQVSKISRRAALAASAGALVFLVGQQAWAAPDADQSGAEATKVEEVVVTASRVQRSGFTAPTPTTVLGSAELQKTGAS